MAIASPEHPAFDPNAEYRLTLGSFEQAFENTSLNLKVFDTELGARVIAGDMDATPDLSMIEGASRIHVLVVEHTRRDDGVKWYRYLTQHLDGTGLPMGQPQEGTYWSDFTVEQAEGLLQDEAGRMRGWLEAARFDFDEAALVVTSAVYYSSDPDLKGICATKRTGVDRQPDQTSGVEEPAQSDAQFDSQPDPAPDLQPQPGLDQEQNQDPAGRAVEESGEQQDTVRRRAAARFVGWLAGLRSKRFGIGGPGPVS